MAAKSLYPTLPSPSSLVLSSDEEEEYEDEEEEGILSEEPLEDEGEIAKMKSHPSLSLNDFENTYLKQKMRSSKPSPSVAVLAAPILRQFCFWVWSFVFQFRYIFAGLFLGLVTILILGEGPGKGEEISCDCHVSI